MSETTTALTYATPPVSEPKTENSLLDGSGIGVTRLIRSLKTEGLMSDFTKKG